MTQKELANQIGINRSSYTNIENSKKNPSLSTAIKIKKVLGYKEDDLFDEIDEV